MSLPPLIAQRCADCPMESPPVTPAAMHSDKRDAVQVRMTSQLSIKQWSVGTRKLRFALENRTKLERIKR